MPDFKMLSKKSGSGLLSSTAGIDRGRAGERLQAALAGLQELHFLKEKQCDMVHWALRMVRGEPLSTTHSSIDDLGLGTEEQRIEATLAALKQQLSRLRRQDVGLKSHLQLLDQQISELKLDVGNASSEHLESDSRPSSGFYELSDGGLGSLSNSCTSVYSECLSSSQTSLLPQTCGHQAGGQAEASRRRSADETAAHGEPPRGSRSHLGSCRIRTRPRPVSTGDLDMMMTPGLVQNKPMEVRKMSLCQNLQRVSLNPKYQSDLVSRGGTEVYRYPSPLHAVALQSPMFSLSADEIAASVGTSKYQEVTAPSGENPEEQPDCAGSRPGGYISKVLQRSCSKGNLNMHQPSVKIQNKVPSIGNRTSAALCILAPSVEEQSLEQSTVNPQDLTLGSGNMSPAAQCNKKATSSSSSLSQVDDSLVLCCCLLQEDSKDSASKEVPVASNKPGKVSEEVRAQPSEDSHSRDSEVPISTIDRSSAIKNAGGSKDHNSHPVFVRAQFVPAGSRHVKVRQADRKTKSTRLRKRSSERLRAAKQEQLHMPRERDMQSSRAEQFAERTPKERGTGQVSRQLTCTDDGGNHLCSEFGLMRSCTNNRPHLQPHLDPSSRAAKALHLCYTSAEGVTSDPTRKKQTPRKWQLSVEVGLCPASTGTLQGQRSKVVQGTSYGSGLVRTVSLKPHLGPSVGTVRLHQPSSSSAYLPRHTSRHPPCSESDLSERSGDAASLFHSTIAESSEGELSDFTANRFGDSESSQGSRSATGSDSSPSQESQDEGDEGGLVWPEAVVGPTAAGMPLQQQLSKPPACRIKASRALKKKIRRFQPASLKVMTLV